jgi:hypothetical protein
MRLAENLNWKGLNSELNPGRGVKVKNRQLYPFGKKSGTHFIGGLFGLGVGVDNMENLTDTGIRSPDRPARSKSLHRLCCPGQQLKA